MSTAVMARPTEKHRRAVAEVVKAQMNGTGKTFQDLADALGQSYNTARNVVYKGASKPAQYEKISVCIEWPKDRFLGLLDGSIPLADAQGAESSSPAVEPERPAAKRRSKTASLRISDVKASKSANWEPPQIPEMPAGPAAGPNAQGIRRLEILVGALVAQVQVLTAAVEGRSAG